MKTGRNSLFILLLSVPIMLFLIAPQTNSFPIISNRIKKETIMLQALNATLNNVTSNNSNMSISHKANKTKHSKNPQPLSYKPIELIRFLHIDDLDKEIKEKLVEDDLNGSESTLT